MHFIEINSGIEVNGSDRSIEDRAYGDRAVTLGSFAGINGTDVLVPVRDAHPEAMILALTREQATQAFLVLSRAIGREISINMLKG